jgi:hypothetical protein
MREIRPYGSVRGVRRKPYPYRDTLQPLRSSVVFDLGGTAPDGSLQTQASRPRGTACDVGSAYFLSAFRMNHPPTPKIMGTSAPMNHFLCSSAIAKNAKPISR